MHTSLVLPLRESDSIRCRLFRLLSWLASAFCAPAAVLRCSSRTTAAKSSCFRILPNFTDRTRAAQFAFARLPAPSSTPSHVSAGTPAADLAREVRGDRQPQTRVQETGDAVLRQLELALRRERALSVRR